MQAKRGRKSAASLMIADLANTIERMPRQKPPHDLNDEEVEVWHAVVMSMPADWFDSGTVPLLSQYCRHVVQARHIAGLIENATGAKRLVVKEYNQLLKMQQRESSIICSLATKMRITQQSITNHRGNKKTQIEQNPWEG
jgi:hypothetical protein